MPSQQTHPPIAYLAGSFPSRSETFVYREVRELRRRGWKVHTVSLNEPQRGVAELRDLYGGLVVVYGSGFTRTIAAALREIIVHPVRSVATFATGLRDGVSPEERAPVKERVKVLGQALAGIGLAGRLRRIGVRHLHCHFAHAPATVGMYAARQLGATFSFVGHANDLFQRRRLLGTKLRRAAFVSCISEWHKDLYRSIEPSRDGAYRVIRCGVDADAGSPRSGAAPSVPTLRVLTVCRLVEKKGVDTLIRALANTGTQHRIDWRLTVAGDGPQREELQQLARSLSVAARVEFLGAVDNTSVPALLSAADVFALPCRVDRNGDRDGIPVALIEAMAAGVPVVAGELPAITELVRDDDTGLLVDAATPAPTAAALARLATRPADRHRLGQSGRRWVAEEFSLSTNIDRLERALTDSLTPPGAPPH